MDKCAAYRVGEYHGIDKGDNRATAGGTLAHAISYVLVRSVVLGRSIFFGLRPQFALL